MANNYEQSETGNWNVAEPWSLNMIYKPLDESTTYRTLALEGCSNIEEDFLFDEQTKILSRIKGLKWYRIKLEQAIRQCIFAIRNANDKKKINDCLKEIVDTKKIHDLVEKKEEYLSKFKISIDEEAFNLVFTILDRLFIEVTEIINRSDLIFNYKEQFDPKKAKRRIKDDFINSG